MAAHSKVLQSGKRPNVALWTAQKNHLQKVTAISTTKRTKYGDPLAKHPSRHGRSYSEEYQIWADMKDRCYNHKSQRFDRYGERGISVCLRWKNSFSAFLDDVGNRPTKKHTLDRIDNDGDYTPENCRWATRKEQMRNTSFNRILTIYECSMPVSAWHDIVAHDTPRQTIDKRLRLGWSDKEAVFGRQIKHSFSEAN